MNEKRGNIDNWLKTAAQQPGPGLDRKDEDEGWAGLSAMLDDDKKRPGIIAGGAGSVSGLRRKRWLLLTAVALMLFLTLFMSYLYLSKDSTDITRPSSSNALTTATPGKTNNTAPDNTGDNGITQQAPTPPSGITQHEEPAEQVAGAVVGQVTALPPAREIAAEARQPRQQPVQRQQTAAMRPAQQAPENVESIKANGLSLQTLPLPHSYGLSLSGAGQHLLTAPSAKAAAVRYPRWAIQAGFLATSDEGRGARVSFMYRLPIKKHFYLQPYIGAAYTGNYDKVLGHMGVQPGKDPFSGQDVTDSIWTVYRVQRMLSADGGIRIGYTAGPVSFGTGIRYHHILHSKGDSATYRKMGPPPSGAPYGPAFSKGNAPGRHSLYWELEAAYQWRFGITTGISYQVLMHESTSPAWQPTVPNISGGSNNSTTIPGDEFPAVKNSLQDKGRLEIYLRMPLKRK